MTIKQQRDDTVRVQIFKALADETRLEIIRILLEANKELSCGEVGERIHISKSTASYHFKNLKEAGLISTRKDAQMKFVKLQKNTFEEYLPSFLNSL